MTTPQPSSEHHVALTSDFMAGGWRLDCSCGYKGPDRKTIGEASRDADEHRRDAA
ncbi:MAG: hypothetical protein ACRDNK_22365 [Solirubrobacteraceae bacterium]